MAAREFNRKSKRVLTGFIAGLKSIPASKGRYVLGLAVLNACHKYKQASSQAWHIFFFRSVYSFMRSARRLGVGLVNKKSGCTGSSGEYMPFKANSCKFACTSTLLSAG